MAGRRGIGGFPVLLILFIVASLYYSRDENGAISRRPNIAAARGGDLPQFAIAEESRRQDSQGTVFAMGDEGLWLTAEHVVHGCDRIGIAMGPGQAQRVDRIYESTSGDAALIVDGIVGLVGTSLAQNPPQPGDRGYHMGFPTGRPAVIESELIGPGMAVRGSGRPQQVLAWAEVARAPDFSHALGGISGGPTLDRTGAVVGINSAASERRGRILTTGPQPAAELLRSAGHRFRHATSMPISGLNDAAERLILFERLGVIRPLYCDVAE